MTKATKADAALLSREFLGVVDPIAEWGDAPLVQSGMAKIARQLLCNEPWLRPKVTEILPKLRVLLKAAGASGTAGVASPILDLANI